MLDINKIEKFIKKDFSKEIIKIQEVKNKNLPELDALFISGGSTKFIGLASAAVRLYELGYNPKIVGGVSAGSIITLPLVLGFHRELIESGFKATPENIFTTSPVTKKGNISFKGVLRAVLGYNSFGVQNIKPLLSSIIKPKHFKEYQNSELADIYILAINPTTGQRKLWNLKDKSIDYNKYLKIVEASCRIPVMTQPEYIDCDAYFDGGLRNHTPSIKILQQELNIKRVASIYSRAQEISSHNEAWEKNVFNNIMRAFQIMLLEISKRDEEMERLISVIRNIELKQFFLPTQLDSMYDSSPELLEKIRQEGVESIDNNIGDFLDV